MKRNLTTLMAAAFAVAMMFTSCSKNDATTSDDNNGNGGGGTSTSTNLKVTFNGNTWTANDFFADLSQIGNENLPRIVVGGSTNWNDANAAYFKGFVGPQTGTYSKDQGYTIGYFENENDYDANGYGNWSCTAGTQQITDLDLNSKTISATSNQTMKNDATGAANIAMTVQMTDAEWRVADLAKNVKGNKILARK